jgi:Dipeptidyl aminopeptidases/acylaminoacyl-peptidases
MKQKILLCILICTCIFNFTSAQEEILKEYTQARRFTPANAEQLLFSYTVTPNYFNNSVKFWYEYKTSEGTKWYVVDPDRKSKTLLFDLDDLASQITEIVKDPFTAQQLPISGLKLLDDDKTFTFNLKSSVNKTFYFSYDYTSRRLTYSMDKPAEESARWASVSPNNEWVVYAKDLNLYRISYADYQKLLKNPKDETISEIQLTTDGVEHFAFGMPRNVLNTDTILNGRRNAVQGNWSPDGRYFVATLVDQREVKDFWVINSIAKPRPTLETYKYHMPGESEAPVSHLYLFDMETKTRKEINTDRFKDQTISLASAPRENLNEPRVWLGDDSKFFLTRVSRDLKRVDICSYTIGEDTIRPVIEERLNTYIETRPLAISDDKKELIHWSERDGWAHLYLYDTEGNLKNKITKGAWHVDQILRVDSKNRTIYFVANGREKDDTTPYYEHLYSIGFDGSGLRLITPGDYFHLMHMDKYFKYVVNNYSRVNTVPKTALYDNRGNKIMDLEESDFSQLNLAGYKFPEPFKVKAADGVTDLYGIIYKPFDFDSTKVYPVINYVYPGPQQEGTYFRYIPMNPRTDRLAQAGFIVVCVGHRGGHPSRSKWYHNYGYGNLLEYPMADHKSAIEQLCDTHKYMDINRVGIHGHSGGGFMSTAAMLLYPDFFKVAVSSAGNHDNNIYNRWWSEKHHGVEEITDDMGNIEFRIKVPTNQDLAKNLKGRLLLIHGEIDNNVHPAGTMVVVNELIKSGKRFDMLTIPTVRHRYDNYNEYFYWRMVDYFSEHLKGNSEKSIDIKDIKLGNWFQGYQ